MSVQDRTLLARLGFADPDKKSPLHDLGCQYVVRSDVAVSLGAMVGISNSLAGWTPNPNDPKWFYRMVNGKPEQKLKDDLVGGKYRRAILEYPVEKGKNQYKTTIGFVDAVLLFEKFGAVFVEVKIGEVGVGEVLRQIKLYDSYLKDFDDGSLRVCQKWILAAAFEMSASFAEALRSEGIIPVYLGDGFRKWSAEQQNAPRALGVHSI